MRDPVHLMLVIGKHSTDAPTMIIVGGRLFDNAWVANDLSIALAGRLTGHPKPPSTGLMLTLRVWLDVQAYTDCSDRRQRAAHRQ